MLTQRQKDVKECYEKLLADDRECGATSIAKVLEITKDSAHSCLKRLRKKGVIPHRVTNSPIEMPSKGNGVEFEVDTPPEAERSVEELLQARKDEFQRNREHADYVNLIPVKIKLDGPIGITHIGDPHIDNSGCDIASLERDMSIIRETEGMLGANVGDAQDNWVGRLAHLYSKTTISQKEAWKLVEWMVNSIPWLYIVGGNHDVWSGTGDPLKWIVAQYDKMGIHQDWQVRMNLKFPNGNETRINCRHDFAGHSQWNNIHGMAKAAKMGMRDHLLVCGHKHVSGYGMEKCPSTGLISHLLRVGTYKTIDDYAISGGFLDGNIAPSAVTIIDPQFAANDPRHIQVILDVEEGADFLTWKRSKR